LIAELIIDRLESSSSILGFAAVSISSAIICLVELSKFLIASFLLVLISLRSFSASEILKSYIKYILCALPFFGITYGINHLLKYSLVINLQLLIRLFAIIVSCVLYYFVIMLITKDKILFDTLNAMKSKLRSIKYKLKAKKYKEQQ